MARLSIASICGQSRRVLSSSALLATRCDPRPCLRAELLRGVLTRTQIARRNVRKICA